MKILIFGAGENGIQAFHIVKRAEVHEVAAFVDDDLHKQGTQLCGVPVLAGQPALSVLRDHGVEGAIAAIGNNEIRLEVNDRLLNCGYTIVNAVHPQAMIDDTAQFGAGVIVEMGVAVHPLARIGDCVFLGGSCVISHHSIVERGALIAGGVVFGGHVHVGPRALIGVGAVLQPHIKIGRGTVVGIGSAVISDLPDDVVAVGVPAKVIRRRYSTPELTEPREVTTRCA